MRLRTEGLVKKFGTHTALDGVNIDIESGELAALLGPSGCGKTTLLRCFAGLEQPDSGRVLIAETDQSGIDVRSRNVGFVFQHYALFRHLTVFENVAFGLRCKPRQSRPAEAEIRQQVHEILTLVQLDNQAQKVPSMLSGGQRQRVALARSLIVQPKILLLDEPFGALDANVRKDLRRWLRRLQDELHLTTILVTHDQEEALEVADKIVLMNKGRLEQVGSPEDLYLHPANPFVYEFLGTVNLFHGRLQDGRFVQDPDGAAVSEPAYVRPHEIEVRRGAFDGAVAGHIRRISFAGPVVRLEIQAKNGRWIEAAVGLEAHRLDDWKAGELVYTAPQRVKLFDYGAGI
jgi:sulfate transport system ATP-binding protein